ncbi:MAG: hypothetical protein Tsb0020_22180 [Haliangiales bacterium]
MSGPRQRIAQNPFYVLGVGVEATRVEVEREGQKLLGMLALGLSAARHYLTPLGQFERTESDIRAAMAELRDPVRRAKHALWADLPADSLDASGGDGAHGGANSGEPAAGSGDIGGSASDHGNGNSNGRPHDRDRAGIRWPGALERLGWRCPDTGDNP